MSDSPLDHIVDDTDARDECREWIYQQFVQGVDADTLLAGLIDNGWPRGDAEAMVEEGRRATRHLRGVVTCEQVAEVAEARYRSSINFASKLAAGGMPLVILDFFLSRLRHPWPKSWKSKKKIDA